MRIDPTLDEILLRAGMDRLGRQLLVILLAEHDDRHVRRCFVHTHKRLHADAVRQLQVQQHDIDPALRKHLQRLIHAARIHGDLEA